MSACSPGGRSYASSAAASPQFGAAAGTEEFAPAPEEPPMADQALPEMGGGDIVENPATAGGGMQPIAAQSRKIVMTANVNMETKDFDAGVDSIARLIEEAGGFVESSYVEGKSLYDERGARMARFTLRVPADGLTSLIDTFAQSFNITGTGQYGDDITDSYYDTQARINSLQIQQGQLLAMLEESAELQYLLEVRRELSNVQYELESLISSINRMDSQVSMSTVNVDLREVVEYEQLRNTPVSFSEELRMTVAESGENFVRFCRNALLVLIVMLPYLAILAVILFVIICIRRHKKRILKKQHTMLQNDLRVHPMPLPGTGEDRPESGKEDKPDSSANPED
jgi:hypothetical protein